MTEEEVTSRWEGIIESPELKLSCQVYEIASCAGLWGRNLHNRLTPGVRKHGRYPLGELVHTIVAFMDILRLLP